MGTHKELLDQFISARNGKPPWSTKAFVRTVPEIKPHDDISCGIFADIFRDKRLWEWINQDSITLEEATDVYMVEVIAESHSWMLQLISCRFSTCLQQ